MKEITLETRTLTGKKAKRLYEKGKIPAVLFNSKLESKNTQMESGDLEALLQDVSTSTIISISLDGNQTKAMIKDVDRNPINGQFRHVSFFEIDENQVMTFEIPVKLVGVSPAVKNNIGVLVQPTKSVELRGKLVDLVDTIEVDISKMETPGDSITLSEIKLPKGMSVINDEQLERSLASITQLQKLVETDEEEVKSIDEEGNIVDEEGNILVDAEDVTEEEAAQVAESAETEEGDGEEGEPKEPLSGE